MCGGRALRRVILLVVLWCCGNVAPGILSLRAAARCGMLYENLCFAAAKQKGAVLDDGNAEGGRNP